MRCPTRGAAGAPAAPRVPPQGMALLHALPSSHWIHTMYRCFVALLAAIVLAGPTAAQSLRKFPPSALRGTVEVLQAPEVALNGKPARLSAGARIFGQDNLIKMSASLTGQKLLVHYTVDTQGYLREVWILTAQEAARKPWPTTPNEAQTWAFDPVSQVWAKP